MESRDVIILRAGSFCSGICAPEVAWQSLGWTPSFFSEIEPSCIKVQQRHFPSVPNLGDMTKLHGGELPDVDLLVAGTPCQAFSVAGLRESLNDARGNLTLVFVRLIREYEATRPLPYVVWENVPGVLSTKDNAFGCFLAGLVGEDEPLVPCGGTGARWTNAGAVYGPEASVAWRILDAQYFGLAQRRKRVFVVRCPGGGADPAKILFESEGVRRDSPPSRKAGQRVTNAPTRGLGSGGADDNQAQAGFYVASTGDRSHCLNGGGMGRLDYESETLIVATDPYPCLRSNVYNNSDPGMEASMLIAHTLRGEGHDAGEDGTGRGTPLVPVAIAFGTFGVRRLLPVECERLQGFPDNYTEGQADSPRYRMLGNSMAVSVLAWIGRRIQHTHMEVPDVA